ncbi:hypothetical protein QR680_016744 [Steinernema hermaphroditum]|uniref:Uncharacterized protein n=1 Tax=Steinernema hermaphroditum TaxID=289476 RepID=A0AA39LMY3_9BILA|nr:hypothetical protein QR680_016744 [Steinernema hermaphroditum]
MALPSPSEELSPPPHYDSLYTVPQRPSLFRRLLQDRNVQRKLAYGFFVLCLSLLFLGTIGAMVVVIVRSRRVDDAVDDIHSHLKNPSLHQR